MSGGDTSAVPMSARPTWRWRASSWLATALGVVVLASVIVYWGWQWFAPAPPPPGAPVAAERWAPDIIASQIFGRAGAPAATATVATAAAQGDTRLLGVFAQKDGAGYALFRLSDRGPVLVRAGSDIAKDMTLVSVRPDGVRIRDRGEMKDLQLRAGTPNAPAARTAPANAASARAQCTPPAGYRGLIYRLNAELLTGIASKPESWSTLLEPVPGGLSVRDGAGIAAMLGMKTGDKMVQANGIALSGVNDVMVAFVNPLVASQPVMLSGTRDGKPLSWWFLNAGACPG